jgi:hypothetical protein
MTQHGAHAEGLHVYLADTGYHHGEHAQGLHVYLADSSSTWTPLAAAAIDRLDPQEVPS